MALLGCTLIPVMELTSLEARVSSVVTISVCASSSSPCMRMAMTTSSSAVLPAALAEPVDGALDLRRAVAHRLDGERRGHAEVVVGVDRDGGVLDPRHAVAQVGDARAKGPRHVVTRGVGDVYHRGARLDGGLDDAAEEVLVGTTGVLGVELDIVHKVARELDGADRALHGFVLGEVELIVQVARAHTQTGVDARTLGGP